MPFFERFFIPMSFILFVAGIILSAILYTMYKKNQSAATMRKKVLPPIRETEYTIRKVQDDLDICQKCGMPFGDSNFCSNCGTTRKVKTIYTFPITTPLKAKAFEDCVNDWLSQNPYIYDCKISINTTTPAFRLGNEYKMLVSSAALSFCVSDKPVGFRYGISYIYMYKVFGTRKYSHTTQLADWQSNNPDCIIVSQNSGLRHEVSGDSSFTEYFNFVLFKTKY